jgi:hypothetical protein
MKDIVHQYLIDPKTMEPSQRLALALQIYKEAHSEVFSGCSYKKFYDSVILPPTLTTMIMVYEINKKIVGYASFHVYELILKDKKITHSIMSEMCLTVPIAHPSHFVWKQMAKHWAKHPNTPIFFLDTFISPFIYKKCCRLLYKPYPTYENKIPDYLIPVALEAAKKFDWKITILDGLIVRELKWRVKEKYLAISSKEQDEDLKYFVSQVPDFKHGKGLVVIAPLSLTHMFISTLKMMLELIHQSKRFVPAALKTLPSPAAFAKTSSSANSKPFKMGFISNSRFGLFGRRPQPDNTPSFEHDIKLGPKLNN